MSSEAAAAAAAAEDAVSPNSEDGGGVGAGFYDLCKGLDVGEDLKREAVSLLKESKNIRFASPFGTRQPIEIEKFRAAYVLFCAAKLRKGQGKEEKKEERIRLCQVLRCSKLKLDDFFKEAQQFSLKFDQILSKFYGSDWEEKLELKQLEKYIKLLTDASKFYDKAYKELFSSPSNVQHCSISGCIRKYSEFYHFGWLLFLALRIHTPELFKDLVSCIHGLVAILAILIIHVPTEFRNFTIQDSFHFVKRSEKGVDLLASLCQTYHTLEDHLKRMMGKAQNLIVDILNRNPSLASECKAENFDQINTDGLIYFKDLLDERSLQSSILILGRHYENAINTQGELDERMFVNDEENLLDSESTSGATFCSTRFKFESLASPTRTIKSMLNLPRSPSSPTNGCFINSSKMVQMTPVSSAMTSAKWLRDVISSLPPKPSTELERFFASCDRDITSDVTRRADIILEAIFPSSSSGGRSISFDTTWAKERKMEALKLYYRVLEAICKAESQLLSENNLTSLLSNERFHRCMLACSAEIVLATHKSVVMMLPDVLRAVGLTAFDLSKVIESFVRHEETLPRELKRHLNSLEEQLLESKALEKGSSLYNSLIVVRPALAVEINRLALLADPMPSLDEIEVHNIADRGLPPLPSRKHGALPDQNGEARSPKRACNEFRSVLVERNSFTPPTKERLLTFNSLKSRVLTLQPTFASPNQRNPVGGGETCAEIGIKIFFSKILKLAAIRIRSLCERLRQSQQILERVYSIFQQILFHQTALFFNRHVDQLILCCLYGVAKVSHANLTFKEIVNNYRKEPQWKVGVFRSVFVGFSSANGNAGVGLNHVDIITFYNEIFIPSVKPLLWGLTDEGAHMQDRNITDGQGQGSPKLYPFTKLPDMSPKKVSASHNVYVSPLRQSKVDTLLPPSAKSYYACVGESTRAYQSPSKDLTDINKRLNCGAKNRLGFDMVSDSVVAGSFGYQNGSSASSEAAVTFNLPVKREQPDD
ncbi:retinoblastoma-related protein-like isoform X2 [Ananas comosus]|uniref:Retinoblastoma-related protein-like isoform X2 n=1 Tax=Ananas comosus TaxID=4615 RepID=A0A6P5GE81_ANACO|nr:retinoblastoma-related protein-like isoform X2 [Ananas comosus]